MLANEPKPEFEEFDLRDLDLPLPNDLESKPDEYPRGSEATWAGNFYAFSQYLREKAPMIGLAMFFLGAIYYKQYYVFSALAFGAVVSYALFDRIIEVNYVNVLEHQAYERDEKGYKNPRAVIIYSFMKIPSKMWASLEKIGSPIQQETKSGEPIYLTMGVTNRAVQFPQVPYRTPHEHQIQLFKLDDMVEMNYKFLRLLTRNVINAKIWMEFKLARFFEYYGTKMATANREFDFDKDGMDQPGEKFELSDMFDEMMKTQKPILQQGGGTHEHSTMAESAGHSE